MKILHIRLQNLNSLTGTWHIDFSDPAYAEDNLFAITGPTGSGKSTLLDAVCLALYGQTPRLAKISKTSNEIMSRHSGICSAEVEFITAKGHFRCHWSQHRSRQRANGELQQPRHEIVDAASNTVLENKLRNVAIRVEEVTGMDFERFTRSTLLAQGGFAAFLKASQSERAPILEQITGTEIYSRLSIRVHELRLDEQKKLEELERSLSHITLLPAEDEEKLALFVNERDREGEKLKTKITALRTQQHWLERISLLQAQVEETGQQLSKLSEEEKQHQGELGRLQPALAARKIEPLHLKQKNLLEHWEKAEKEGKALNNQLTGLEKQKRKLQTGHEEAVNGLHLAEKEEKRTLDLIKVVQRLDHDIGSTRDRLLEKEKQLTAQQQQKDDLHAALKSLEEEYRQVRNSKTLLENHFKEHGGDENLLEEFKALKIKIHGLMDLHDQILSHAEVLKNCKDQVMSRQQETITLKKKQNSLERAAAKTGKLLTGLTEEIKLLLQGKDATSLQQELFQTLNRQKQVDELQLILEEHGIQATQNRALQEELSRAVERHGKTNNKLHLLQKELASKKQERELLENNLRLLARIKSLEEERKQLKDHTPCPLCGSTDHPYRSGKIPELSEEETQLHKTKDALKTIEKEEREFTRLMTVDGELQNSLARQIEELETARLKGEKRGEQLLSDLDLPSLSQLDTNKVSEERQKLIAQRETLQERCEQLDGLSLKQSGVTEERDRLAAAARKIDKEILSAEHLAFSALAEEARNRKQEEELDKNLTLSRDALSLELGSYGFDMASDKTLMAIEKELAQRVTEWKLKKDEEEKLNTALLTLNSTIGHNQKLLKEFAEQLTEEKEKHGLIQKDLGEREQERSALFGSKETSKEAKRLERAVREERKIVTTREKELGELERQRTRVSTIQERLEQEQHNRAREIDELAELFNEALQDSPFATMEEFLAARVAPDALEKLQTLHKNLQRKKTDLQALLKDKTATLQKEEERQLSREQPENLKKNLQEKEKQLESLQEQAGAAREKLRINGNNRRKSAAGLEGVEHQKKTVGRWKRLHMLIGSADGKKFRNFAQGLTFEMVVNHANAHLRRMNERYILVRDKKQPLDLNVIDTWQAGEIRSTKNLSGGESFLVSLALALGLSRMASNNVRVDSLFLDEGFGTLDEEALDSALDGLAGLREENKLIAIISHVKALKERIPLQIEIVPGPGGRSRIKGAGVRREGT